ncbi:hypothetical protein PMIN01_12057 [Paraphaeosphaeria minitans]|uniref:F-box domain-containing protein n=1 Tax=Paraphaeosphaeria minitans TaxID=565426 RepID=A0A9P6G767_9PLEO|nr:hypothetical protein PMIN01_12057 [Paraphaeosphaeria minitans]
MRILYREFPRFGNLRSFLSTILKTPRLASHVRVVDIPYRCSIWTEDLPFYWNSITRMNCSDEVKSYWIRSLQLGDNEAFMAFVLAHLPKLRQLSINSPFDPQFYQYQECNLELFTIFRVFSDLQVVSLQGLPYHARTLALFLGVPSLQKIHLSGTTERYPVEHVSKHEYSNVEEIVFESIRMSFSSLIKIILSPKRLRRFTFYTPVDDRIVTRLSELFRALETFTDTLEELNLRYFQRVWNRPRTSCSLSNFKRLRSFTCDAAVFLDYFPSTLVSVFLPRSIERLHIHDIAADFMEKFNGDTSVRADLASQTDGMPLFPQLHEVRLVYSVAARKADMLRSYSCTERNIQFSLERFDT